MDIGILLFDQFTALDVIGPYEVLSRLPGARVQFVGSVVKGYSDGHGVTLRTASVYDTIAALDILLIPGGFGIDSLLGDALLIAWLREMDRVTQWTASVCSGSILLAQAGILTGRNCTTHWRRKKQLAKYDVTIVNERYVRDGKYVTSAGVSAGIDMALYLAGLVAGEKVAQTIQLALEYDPMPPYNCGSPEKAPAALVKKLSG